MYTYSKSSICAVNRFILTHWRRIIGFLEYTVGDNGFVYRFTSKFYFYRINERWVLAKALETNNSSKKPFLI